MVMVDPSDLDPLSQLQTEHEIMRLSHRLTAVTNELIDAVREEARARVAYERKHARVWLDLRGFDGTIPEKTAEVMDRCGDEFERMELAKAEVKIMVRSGDSIGKQLDALRSINKNVRQAIDYSHGRGG